MDKLQAALGLASRGFRVFPLQINGKIPVIKDFPRIATTDKGQIQRWFYKKDYNIGISTNDLLALDVDVKDGAQGLKTLAALKEKGLKLPDTCTQVTPTGGLHYIYKPPFPISNSASKLGAGLDTRGLGGYLVGAGSTINGISYEMDAHPIEASPETLLELCSAASEEKPRAREVEAEVDPAKAWERGSKYLASLSPVEGAGRRNHEGFKTAAALKDIGASEGDTFMLMLEEWKCEPMIDTEELKHVVRSAFYYGKNPQGSASPEAMFKEEPAEEGPEELHPIENINKNYAYIVVKGNNYVLFESTDEDGQFKLEYMPIATFHTKNLANTTMINSKEKSVTDMWIRSARRRSYEGVVFSPGKEVEDRFYNLWRGFGVQDLAPGEEVTLPMSRAVKAFEEHLFLNMCEGDIDLFHWTKAWFAHIVQKPWEKPGVALVLKGKKGVGKNVIFEAMRRLMPNNYRLASNSRYLVGNFNSHLENLLLFVADEAFWGGDTASNGILKGLITDDRLEIERKGIDSYSVKSCVRVAILGNEDWLVPSSEDERRYAIFNMGEGRKQDRKFFTQLTNDMKEGGARYLFHVLKNFDLTPYDVGSAPKTEGLHDQKIRSLNAEKQWWFECLANGSISDSSSAANWPEEMLLEELKGSMYQYCDRRGSSRYKSSAHSFVKTLKEICPGVLVVRGQAAAVAKLPSLETARKEWEKHIGHIQDWE